MKKILFLLLPILVTLTSQNSRALPVITEGVGTSNLYFASIVPDSDDKNLFYFFPYRFILSEDDGKIAFTYYEKKSFWSVQGFANMMFKARISKEAYAKIEEIKRANPNAKFAQIPVLDTLIESSNELSPFLKSSQCQKKGSQVDGLIACLWEVNSHERRAFRKILKADGQIQVLQTHYHFVAKTNDGSTAIFEHFTPMYLGKKIPDSYFFNYRGNIINDFIF